MIRTQINVGHTFGGVTFSFLWFHYHSSPLGEEGKVNPGGLAHPVRGY